MIEVCLTSQNEFRHTRLQAHPKGVLKKSSREERLHGLPAVERVSGADAQSSKTLCHFDADVTV